MRILRILSSMLIALAAMSSMPAAELRISITDESKKPVWTRVEVRGPDDHMYQPSGALVVLAGPRQPSDRNYTGSFVVNGAATLQLPAGRYTVVAEHGLEYERVEKIVNVAAAEPSAVAIQLRPWIRMRARGWYSGDMHLHSLPAEAPALLQAEDLDIGVNFTIWNKRNIWKDGPLGAEPIVRVGRGRFLSQLNAEDERGGGAWMLHNLKRELPNFAVDGRWFPPGIAFVRAARQQKTTPRDLFPWFDSEKLFWWEVPVMMALAPPDSMGVAHNQFDQYSMVAHEAWGRPRNQALYPGSEGFADYTLQLYYRYLNLGFHLPPSAGSANGVLPNPVGYNRMYVPVKGELTVEKWYAAVRAGKVLVTNGPILFFDLKTVGPHREGSIEVHAREPIDRVEIVANGKIIQTLKPTAGALNFAAKVQLDLERYSWVAARCFLRHEETVRFAHTAPIYLPGQWNATEDAQYFEDWIDELIAQTEADPKRFASDAEKQEVLALYRQARAFYGSRKAVTSH